MCVQLLTPVIAACFDVFFNVVLCCLLMYILIIIKGNLNQPLLVTKVDFFRCSYNCLFEREKQSPLIFFFPLFSSLCICKLPMIVLSNDPLKSGHEIAVVPEKTDTTL